MRRSAEMLGMVIAAAVVWAGTPMGASATGCEADIEATLAVPGDSVAIAEAACEAPPAKLSAGSGVSSEGEVTAVAVNASVDAIDDDQDDLSVHVSFFASCTSPDDQGPVMQTVCPVVHPPVESN